MKEGVVVRRGAKGGNAVIGAVKLDENLGIDPSEFADVRDNTV